MGQDGATTVGRSILFELIILYGSWWTMIHRLSSSHIKYVGQNEPVTMSYQDESARHCSRMGLEVYLYVHMPFGILMYRQLFFLFLILA